MLFDDVLARLETALDVPYPERAQLLQELGADLDAAYRSLRAEGVPEVEARERALRMFELDDTTRASLQAVHLPVAQRLIARIPPPARDWLEATATALPLAGLVYFLI